MHKMETILIGESEGYVKSNMLFFKGSEIYQHEIECITDRRYTWQKLRVMSLHLKNKEMDY